MQNRIFNLVIIGGGTAGLVLANRLTEDAATHVVVLEAGEDLTSDPRVTTPALFPTLLGSDADWNTPTEPQEAAGGKRMNISHGRVLGGSSAINGQAFVATSKIGVDTWAALGNPGWDWDTLSPYFQKAHTLVSPSDPAVREHLRLDYIDANVSGHNGPMQTSFPDDLGNPLPKAWIETLERLGHRCTGDPFSGEITGAYTNAASIDAETRQRSYSASAYLQPVRHRPNLHVVTGATVQKIVLDNGETMTVHARDEVILYAGTLHSPKLLELSGIGDARLLNELGIPVIIDNKYVSENLQDHPMTGFSFEVREGVDAIDDLLRQDPASLQHAMEQYAANKSGPLGVGGIFSYALLALQEALSEEGRANIRKLSQTSTYPEDQHPLEPAHTAFPGHFYSIAIGLLQPLSRGSVHIRDAEPSSPVKIDPKYLSHPLDLEALARHMTYIGTIAATEPLASLLKPGGRRNAAAPSDLSDLAAVREYVRATVLSSWHPTSTCAMLPAALGGVVSPRLVVHGTRNLRVVDASVFPVTTRGNPMATVYAVAERAADLIKADRGRGR
ncbi:glucose-methanol-choline oxidoreductase-like protein [Massariosphaeria phaeospora]|uniref:Glucose-methanol-choline oxidoreductase-like protein n=1 Tax=Massariosphaeria phaeospora TaxID=100035 RepID=A0A7C8MDP7_9PLEO|nr:glucose-methanol-choline oxidoreductase-like protein [Massariosphaeria phaeospora]